MVETQHDHFKLEQDRDASTQATVKKLQSQRQIRKDIAADLSRRTGDFSLYRMKQALVGKVIILTHHRDLLPVCRSCQLPPYGALQCNLCLLRYVSPILAQMVGRVRDEKLSLLHDWICYFCVLSLGFYEFDDVVRSQSCFQLMY